MADTEAKWYILHTYSGYENKVANDIMKVVENRNLQNVIEEVYLPVEMTKQTKENGKEVEVEEKLFPSYVFVKMIITNESWYICRNTRGVTGFVGPGSQPTPLSEEEVKNLGIIEKETSISFDAGDRVSIKSGPLEGFEGGVKSIDLEHSTADVDVSMFGRSTPATLELSAIAKI